MPLRNRIGLRATGALPTALLMLAIGAGFVLDRAASRAQADENATASDVLKAIQGTWVTEDGIDSRWTFEGETLKASVNGQDYTCKVKLDPAAKPHATMDLAIDDGPDDAKGKMSKCIYKLDGEKLTLCVSLPAKDRPKDFETADGEAYVFELKKEKPKDKVEKKD